MPIADFFDQSVTITRLRSVGGDRKAYQGTATVEGHVQALDDEARQMLGIVEEKAWKAWFDASVDIQEQDRITDGTTGTVYVVREIVRKNYAFGTNVHTEVILMEQNE